MQAWCIHNNSTTNESDLQTKEVSLLPIFFDKTKNTNVFDFFCLSRLSGKRVNKSFLSFFPWFGQTKERSEFLSRTKKIERRVDPFSIEKSRWKNISLILNLLYQKNISKPSNLCLSREIFPDNPQTFYLST